MNFGKTLGPVTLEVSRVFAGRRQVPPTSLSGSLRHGVRVQRSRRTSGRHKVLHSEWGSASHTPRFQGKIDVSGPRVKQGGRLASVDLVRGQQVDDRQQMDGVVPGR
jgi:hypothetical protein